MDVNLIHLLIQLGLADEKERFEEFYELQYKPLYNFVFKMVRSQECALDLTQESFARLLPVWEKVKENGSRKNYLFTIAANLCRDRGRRAGKNSYVSLDVFPEFPVADPDTGSNIERRTELNHFEEILEKLIECLPEREKTVLYMKKLDGMTYDDITAATGISIRTLKRIVKKALDFIIKEMEKHGVVEEGGLV